MKTRSSVQLISRFHRVALAARTRSYRKLIKCHADRAYYHPPDEAPPRTTNTTSRFAQHCPPPGISPQSRSADASTLRGNQRDRRQMAHTRTVGLRSLGRTPGHPRIGTVYPDVEGGWIYPAPARGAAAGKTNKIHSL